MPNTRKILIIDDDPELRGALTEQLSLYEEYEASRPTRPKRILIISLQVLPRLPGSVIETFGMSGLRLRGFALCIVTGFSG